MTLDDLIALEKRMTAKPWSSTKHNTRFWVGDVGDPRVNNSCDQCVSDLKGVATFRNVLPELLDDYKSMKFTLEEAHAALTVTDVHFESSLSLHDMVTRCLGELKAETND